MKNVVKKYLSNRNVDITFKVSKSEISYELRRNISMSVLGQKIFDEGIERGIEIGREKVIEKMLLKGMTEEDVSNILDVDVSIVIKIKYTIN